MIEAPPFAAFMVTVYKINHDLARFLRLRYRALTTWQMTLLVVLWLWFVLRSIPGLADFLKEF